MTKQLSPLEAYNRLCSHLDYDNSDYMHNGSYEEDNDIIETALKDYIEVKKDNFEMDCRIGELENELQEKENELKCSEQDMDKLKDYEKKSKVLEIIKEKRVILFDFDRCKTVEEYNDKVKNLTYAKKLTKEEFDLLKEELGK